MASDGEVSMNLLRGLNKLHFDDEIIRPRDGKAPRRRKPPLKMRMCNLCNKVVKKEDTYACFECSHIICPDCARECDACHVVYCLPCAAGILEECPDRDCELQLCDSCTVVCQKCGNKNCKNHAEECESEKCQRIVCFVCGTYCDDCGRFWYCDVCTKGRACNVCLDPICPKCDAAYTCSGCKRRFCNNHVPTCAMGCGHARCNNIACVRKFAASHTCTKSTRITWIKMDD